MRKYPSSVTSLRLPLMACLGLVAAFVVVSPAIQATERNADLSLSTGPRSDDERTFLWQQARAFVEARDWLRADATLERLNFRYPDHPQRLEAQLLRGAILIELKRTAEALPVLREAWQAGEKFPQWALPAGELLGRAWIELGRLTEAVLLSQELRLRATRLARSDSPQASLARRARSASWRIEAHARLAKRRMDRVDGLLRTLATEEAGLAVPDSHAGFRAETDWLALSVKRHHCRRIFDRSFSSEAALLRAVELTYLCEREMLARTMRVSAVSPQNEVVTSPSPSPSPSTSSAPSAPTTDANEVAAPLPFAFPDSADWLERNLADTRKHLMEVARFCRAPRALPPAAALSVEEKRRFSTELTDEIFARCEKEQVGLLRLVSDSTPVSARLRTIVEEAFSSPSQGARRP